MNKRYIIGAAIAIVFLVVALFSYQGNTLQYSDFHQARESGDKVQVMCSWVKEKPASYNPEKNEFSFYGKDKQGNLTPVVFNGAKPNNFDIAPEVVVTGRYNDAGLFVAEEILTKCPSKYEPSVEDLKKN